MDITSQCLNIIKEFEGLRLVAYRDSGGIWTIGWGHTKGVKEGDVISTIQAEEFLLQDIQSAVKDVNSLNIEFTQNQFDALVSLVYNIGLPKFKKKYLYTLIRTNPYNMDIRPVWQKTAVRDMKGNELKGLIRRRLIESNIYCI